MTAAQHTHDRRAPTVLVIDDENYVADMLASILELDGYSVHVAYNGREGLALAGTLPVDLVITDIMMPFMNGITLIEELRKLDHIHAVPVLLMSAGAGPCEPLPNVRFIPKHLDLDRVLQLVATMIESRGARA